MAHVSFAFTLGTAPRGKLKVFARGALIVGHRSAHANVYCRINCFMPDEYCEEVHLLRYGTHQHL
jgi:hypothetical protein